ncbi:MAG: glycosyl hydrolase 53 family protein [Muribaculaceae bacterium]|nr:glycosyl hydrolase 53 family protein [Muribaculaceae bacterium]
MMRRVIVLVWVLAVVLPAVAQSWLGGDISMMTSNARHGVIYKDSCGVTVEPYDLFRQQGWNMMRVRLFVDPQNAPGPHHDQGVCQDLDYVIGLCRTIKARGFEVMLDFHYSDTWADPAKQFTPKRWEGLDGKTLADSIYRYTRHCLLALKAAGVVPATIQVGNEITYGMDWPVGRIDPLEDTNWDVFTRLLKAGSKACREVCPASGIIIHTEKAGVWEMTRSYYDRLKAAGVDYDIIGLSYYPMWHGTIPNLGATLDSLAVRFPDKPVMIVEAAYYYLHDGVNRGEEDFTHCLPGTIEGQREFTAQLVNELNRYNNVTGLFWWYPEENLYGTSFEGSGWGLNRGLFNSANGKALPALYEMAKFKR